MKITTEVIGSVAVIILDGKILIGEGDDQLREAVLKALDEGHRHVVLDLAAVPYVDSSGLCETVRCYTIASRRGGKLVLCNLTKKIQDLLAITKLLTVFETYESRAAAVESLRNR